MVHVLYYNVHCTGGPISSQLYGQGQFGGAGDKRAVSFFIEPEP
jgi:hypothetical protein